MEELTRRFDLEHTRSEETQLTKNIFENRSLLQILTKDISVFIPSKIIDDIIYGRSALNKINRNNNELLGYKQFFCCSTECPPLVRWLDFFLTQVTVKTIIPWIEERGGISSASEISMWIDSCSECKQSNTYLYRLLSWLFGWSKFLMGRYLISSAIPGLTKSNFFTTSEESLKQIQMVFRMLDLCLYKPSRKYEFDYLFRFLKLHECLNMSNPHEFLLRIFSYCRELRITRTTNAVLIEKIVEGNFFQKEDETAIT